jgi:Protein of unknown function (DUF2723)
VPLNRLTLAFLWIAWCFLVFLVPTTVGLRDSGEFLIAPIFLDIIHSAGFPTFSQIANVLTFIPTGPLTFRVHLFSALCALGLIVLTVILTRCFTQSLVPGSHHATRAVGTIVAMFTLIGTTPFWRSALSSEAYALNCVLAGAALWAVLRSVETGDARLIPLLGVLTGIGVGNHVVFTPLAAAAVAILAFRRPPIYPMILGGAFSLFSGIAVYGYLPVRTLAFPPLNTGSPDSLARVWNHLSSARDGALRPLSTAGAVDGPNTLSLLLSDLTRLALDTSLFSSGLALVGFFWLLIRNPFGAALVGSLLLVPLFFFAGWELEPWIPSSVATAIGAGLGAAFLLERMKSISAPVQAALTIATIFGVSIPLQERLISLPLASHTIVDEHARSLLRPLPRESILVTEPSWFILRHITAVSGYRDDTALVYQPAITFPEYFAPVRWNGQIPPPPAPLETAVGQLAAFVDHASRFGTLHFEPTTLLVESFSGVLSVSGSPFPYAQRGVPGSASAGAGERYGNWVKNLKLSALTAGGLFSPDIAQYCEVLGNNFAALFNALKRDSDAHGVFRSLCDPPLWCLPQSVNNYSLVLLRLSRPCEARKILEAAIHARSGSVPRALFHNLRIARQECAVSGAQSNRQEGTPPS